MSNAVLLNIENGIARITLNRPERLNAFDPEVAEGWAEACEIATQTSEVSAIVVTGSGRAFCAGGDVRAMAAMQDRREWLQTLAARINDGILALVESSKPVVAAAQGVTAGGGLGILLATDYAVIGESSRVGSIYAGVGLTPDLSVSAQLARAVGERRALQLVLQDSLLSADEAIEWGLAAEKVADDQVLPRAQAIAEHWAANAYAYGEAKRLVRAASTRSLREQLADEARTIGVASITPEGEARIAAFAARES